MLTRWVCLKCRGPEWTTTGVPVGQVRCPTVGCQGPIRAIHARPSTVRVAGAVGANVDTGLALLLEAQQ